MENKYNQFLVAFLNKIPTSCMAEIFQFLNLDHMSSTSRFSANNKSLASEGKEQQKVPSKPGSAGDGIPASSHNPPLPSFHSVETSSTNSLPLHEHGGFQKMDKIDEHSSSSRSNIECDLVSNNDVCSVESEDRKEKTASGIQYKDAIPGCDSDKRDKIRQKNEKKHQRQREKRAYELHERCNGYLMSRKLESLAEQLVAMGFSSEQATMALILNDGRVEESIVWLLEGGEEAAEHYVSSFGGSSGSADGNLQIDITEELAQVKAFETRYQCSRKEVERAVVACEGDLEKTAVTLMATKRETSAVLLDKTDDPPKVNGGKLAESVTQGTIWPQVRSTASVTIQKRDGRNFNYPKAASVPATYPESSNKNMQSLRISQPKPELRRPLVVTAPPGPATTAATTAAPAAALAPAPAPAPALVPAPAAREKIWSSAGSRQSVSCSSASSLQVASSTVKPEIRFVAVGNVKNLPEEALREPMFVMQQSQSNTKQNSSLATSFSSSTGTARCSYPDSVSGAEINNLIRSSFPPPISSAVNPRPSGNPIMQQHINHQHHYQSIMSSSAVDYSQAARGGEGGSWRTTGTSPSHLPTSPPNGYFLGLGSSEPLGPTSPPIWSTGGGLMPPSDYANIDWTTEIFKIPTRTQPSGNRHDSLYDLWSSEASTGYEQMIGSLKPNDVHDGDGGGGGATEGFLTEALPSSASTVLPPSQEWTTPFAGKDLFSIPRQFVTSESL